MLKKAVLAGADLTDASLAGADLEGADLSEAVIDGADFSAVHAPGILAMKLSLPGLRAPGIVLTKAKFIECNLQGADLTGANAGTGGVPAMQPRRHPARRARGCARPCS